MSPRNGHRILLVEDEDVIRNALQRLLEKEGYQVICCTDGKSAEALVAIDKFSLVISDIHMPGSRVSGVELLSYVKTTQPSLPVVLMTGFATLAETRQAHEMGASGFLAKPFQKEDLLKIVREFSEPEASAPAEPDLTEDDKYNKLSIDDFISGKHIRFTIFVRLSATKYVKIAHQGEDLDVMRVRLLKEKGIRYLYLLKPDFQEYIRFNLGLVDAVRVNSTISPEKKMNFLKHTGEIILERLFTDEIETDAFNNAKVMLESTVNFLADSRDTLALLESLNNHADFLYAHCLAVSLYSSMIAKQIGWHSPQTLYKVSMGGLLHDVGLKEIDRSILEKSRSTLTLDELRSMETHPTRGTELLGRDASIPSDVLQIILQHHERDQGTGYPAGLIKNRIHPLARLIGMVDEFCELLLQAPGYMGTKPRDAFKRLLFVHSNSFDPQYMLGLKKLLQIKDE